MNDKYNLHLFLLPSLIFPSLTISITHYLFIINVRVLLEVVVINKFRNIDKKYTYIYISESMHEDNEEKSRYKKLRLDKRRAPQCHGSVLEPSIPFLCINTRIMTVTKQTVTGYCPSYFAFFLTIISTPELPYHTN